MGAWGGAIGTSGGLGGTGITGPNMANVTQSANMTDVNNAEGRVNNSLDAQNNLLAALQGQNGIGMQSNVANQQQGLANQLQSANGVGTQQGAIQGLQNAAGMYGQIAQGQGPNPAQAMLNQQTGQNIAAQSALMAGQRGAGANAGLMARQAGQQGGNLQQQAVGQGASMQAQQALNALQGYAGTQQAIGGMGAGLTGQLQGQQGAMGNMANQIAGQQIAQTNNNTAAAQNNLGQWQQSVANQNNANIANQANVNNIGSQMANTRANQSILSPIVGGILSSGGQGAAGGAHGGEVIKMAGGGPVIPQIASPYATMAIQGPQSSFGQYLQGGSQQSNGETPLTAQQGNYSGNKSLEKGAQKAAGKISKYLGDSGNGLADFSGNEASTGAESLAGGDAAEADAGADAAAETATASEGGGLAADAALAAQAGGKIKAKSPAQKAVKSGDSYSNDKIPARLSEGEIVLPRSITMSADPVKAAADFVSKIIAQRKKG